MEENLQNNENEKTSTSKNVLIAVLALIIIAIVGSVLYFTLIKKDDTPADNSGEDIQETEESKPTSENELVQDENVETGTYGVAYVSGYAKVDAKSTCDDECRGDEPKVNVVSFYVTDGKVDEISEWLNIDENDQKEYISLGCVENELIHFIAMANEFYRGTEDGHINSQEYYSSDIILSEDDTKTILSSSENEPITLRIEKKPMKKNIRMGLYTCNSIITGVEVIK